MINPILRAINSTAINKTARIVTSQRGCADGYADLSREELIALNTRLLRKQRLIYTALGINKKQAMNLRKRIRAGGRTKKFDGRLALELVRVGDNLLAVSKRISEYGFRGIVPRSARQKLGEMEKKWCEEHPGFIWDGRQLVAPNGQAFSRWRALQSMESHQ